MRKLILALVTGLVAAAIATGTAFAGEVTGNGKDTPIRDGVAKSECAFSGLDEAFSGPDDPDAFTHAQSWGQLSKDDRAFLASIGLHPSEACNGHLSPQK
jgi:hypothetical protein